MLNRFHNKVWIGIAYSSTYVYFVEDFEYLLSVCRHPNMAGIEYTGRKRLADTQSYFGRRYSTIQRRHVHSERSEQRIQPRIRSRHFRRWRRRRMQQHLLKFPRSSPSHHISASTWQVGIKRTGHPVLAFQFRPRGGSRVSRFISSRELERPGVFRWPLGVCHQLSAVSALNQGRSAFSHIDLTGKTTKIETCPHNRKYTL